MRDSAAIPSSTSERKLSGGGRLFLGFVLGALFALAPIYYFYMGREAALRAPTSGADQTFTSALENSRAVEPRGASNAFASRLTYELSQLPEEPLVVSARAPVIAAAAPVAARAAPVDEAAERVSNARPITAVPPPARDRTQAIEQEAQRADYRAAAPTQPRVFEGREVDLKPQPKLPDTPTRPIVANTAVNTRAEIEAERARLAAEVARAWPRVRNAEAAAKSPLETRTVVATAPASSPVGRVPEAREPDAGSRQGPPPPGNAASAAASATDDSVEARFAATREWLSSAAQTTHTIQLMGTHSEEQLKSHLKALSKTLEPGRIFVFRTLAQGKPSISVVYGAYPDRQAALQALGKLPASLTANKPVLRTVNGIRAEMRQHKTDS